MIGLSDDGVWVVASRYSRKRLTSPKAGVEFPRPKQTSKNGKNARSLLARKAGVFVLVGADLPLPGHSSYITRPFTRVVIYV
jgi:hypothetical protein